MRRPMAEASSALEVEVERGHPNQGALAEAASATQPLQAAGGGSVTLEQASSMRPFLTRRRQLVVVGDVARLSHDVIRLRLILPPHARVLGLPVGQHLKVTLTLTLTLTLTQTLTPNPNP